MLAMSLCSLIPFTSQAAEAVTSSVQPGLQEAQIEPRTVTSKSFVDGGNNTIRVTGTSVKSDLTALASTGFQVTACGTDWDSADGCRKVYSCKSTIYLQNGQTDKIEDSADEEGRTGSCGSSKACKSIVTSMATTHNLTCNGRSIAFNTFD